MKVRLKGGKGSGHRGHAGRPGSVGGSVAGAGSGLQSATSLDWVARYNKYVLSRASPLPIISDDWLLFDKVASGIVTEKLRAEGGFGLCAYHSLEGCKRDPGLSMAVGRVYTSEDISNIKGFDPDKYWQPGVVGITHVWNVDSKGCVVDKTLGSGGAVKRTYVGEIVARKTVATFKDDGDVLSYAVKMINRRSGHTAVSNDAQLADALDEEYERWSATLKQLPIADESMTALVKARVNIFFDESDALAVKMFTGKVSLGQWQESMKQLIRECHASCAAIGGGGWDEMTWAQWGRLGTPLREQYRWLQGFTEFISENREDISLRAIQARARLYGEGAGGSTVLMQAGPVLEGLLPWIPKDGSTECLNRCHCVWILGVTGKQPDGSQEVQAVWTLLPRADHCDDCMARDGHVEMLVVPVGEVVPSRIGGI